MRQQFYLVLFLLILTTLGCGHAMPAKSTSAAPSGPVKVTVVNPRKQALTRLVDQPGMIKAYQEAPIHSRVSGYVRQVKVDIGDKVKGPRAAAKNQPASSGDVLATVDVPEMLDESQRLQALGRQSEAQVGQAKAKLATANANVQVAEAAIREARAALARTHAHRERRNSENQRVAALVTKGVMDQQAGEEAENQFKAAIASEDEAKAHIASVEASLRKSIAERQEAEADILAADANVAVREAECARHQTMIDFATLHAPFDGIITRRFVDTGHYLQAQRATPLFVVAQENKVRVLMEVPEAMAGLVHAGCKATIHIPSLPGPAIEAKVARTSWALEQTSRTLHAEVDLDNPQGHFRAGMYTVTSIATTLPETFVLPAAALAKQGEQAVCFLVEDGKARRAQVIVGVTAGEWTQVLRLQTESDKWTDFSGEESIAAPAALLTDGQALDIVPEAR